MGTWKRSYRDEDLALFHDMRRRERKNFLILSAEDAEASPMSTPTRTGRELLAVDSEKNDFDWLLTPPSTPLFPSLDREGSMVNLSQSRVLTRSASVSRNVRLSYVQEPSPRVVHCGNPSPKRPSTASSTSSTVSTSRGRALSPSLTSRSSPTVRSSSPCRPVTPTRRNSVVSCRSSSRSLTPTLQRNNTSPSTANGAGLLSGRSRGKSLSPKLGPWDSSLVGFSAEPPPNLRTSLSERTIQRGVSRISRNKSKTRSSSVDTFDACSQSRWHLDSANESKNWSSSFSIDHSSSQNSRASAISYDDDVEMTESVLSGSTNSDTPLKCGNAVNLKMEEPALRKSVLPAKRQMKTAGSATDTMAFLSVSGRKSYERQTAQRRNAQAMFRPLLSSAPVTSFCSGRIGGMHCQSSGSLTDPFTAQSSSLHGSRNGGIPGESATDVSRSNDNCKLVCGCQQTIEEEAESLSISEENTTGRYQSDYDGKISEERLADSKERLDNHADGHKAGTPMNAGNRSIASAKRNKDPEMFGEATGVLPSQCLIQRHQAGKAQPADTGCAMDFEVSNLSSMQSDSHSKGGFTNQEKISCPDDHAGSSIVIDLSTRKSDLKREESKVKENHAEEQKLAASGKASCLGFGNALSQHISQRVLSDLGSFRRHSPGKTLHIHLHDNSSVGEKNWNCTSSLSDSRSLSMSSPSGNGRGQSTDFESPGGSVVGNSHIGSTAMVDKSCQFTEKVPSASEKDLTKKGAPSFNSAGAMGYPSEKGVVSEGSSISAVATSHVTSGFCSAEMDLGLVSISGSKVSCGSSENSQVYVSTSDKAYQHASLSEIGSCVSQNAMLHENGVQLDCTEADCNEPTKSSFDFCASAGNAGEDPHADDPSPRQAPGVLLSKRSVTLEEATDTILFCSSVVHELVYKAASLALENEEQRLPKPSISRRDFVALFGFSGAENRPDNRSNGVKTANGARNRKHRPLASGAVCKTSSSVQKQRMVHSQTPLLTMRQSPMERIENAVVGNHEKMHTPESVVLPKKKVKQKRRAKCRCSCCMM